MNSTSLEERRISLTPNKCIFEERDKKAAGFTLLYTYVPTGISPNPNIVIFFSFFFKISSQTLIYNLQEHDLLCMLL